jgi:hypothetical protein
VWSVFDDVIMEDFHEDSPLGFVARNTTRGYSLPPTQSVPSAETHISILIDL